MGIQVDKATSEDKAHKRAVVLKADSDRHLITAVTNVVTDELGNSLVDQDGDVIKIDNLEDAFINAFSKGGEGMSGVMHERSGGADIVQHFTLSRSEWEALKPYIGKEIGIVKIKVTDPSIWADVKAGKLPEVSIEGDGERTPL